MGARDFNFERDMIREFSFRYSVDFFDVFDVFVDVVAVVITSYLILSSCDISLAPGVQESRICACPDWVSAIVLWVRAVACSESLSNQQNNNNIAYLLIRRFKRKCMVVGTCTRGL